eukprot:scaffold1220_cov259-Pinguiococcus_pyrenoidosus.AAC.56
MTEDRCFLRIGNQDGNGNCQNGGFYSCMTLQHIGAQRAFAFRYGASTSTPLALQSGPFLRIRSSRCQGTLSRGTAMHCAAFEGRLRRNWGQPGGKVALSRSPKRQRALVRRQSAPRTPCECDRASVRPKLEADVKMGWCGARRPCGFRELRLIQLTLCRRCARLFWAERQIPRGWC